MDKELNFILENTPLPAFVATDQGLITASNAKMSKILCYAPYSNQPGLGSVFDFQSCQIIREILDKGTQIENIKPLPAVLLCGSRQDCAYVELSWKKIETSGGEFWYFIVYDVNKFKQEIENLELQATKDELTGINNRWRFFNKFDEEIKRAKRYEHDISLILMDIDYFKNINDTYGHPAGDCLLKTFASVVEPLLRESDVFGRLGGDEFAILMPEANINQAHQLASRIEKSIKEASFTVSDERLNLSSSIGVAAMSGNDITRKDLLERSDAALYKAKYNGRNQVIVEHLCSS